HNVLQVIDRMLAPQPEAIVAEEVVGPDSARTPGQLTARALSQQSRRVGLGLIAAGVEPDAPVILLAKRDLPFWVTMIGILRAGAAYLPIDPELPAQRIAQVIDESGASTVITRPEHHSVFAEEESLRDGGRQLKRLIESDLHT